MSKFKIYKLDSSNPERAMKRTKVLTIILGFASPVTILLTDFIYNQNIKLSIYVVTMGLLIYLMYQFYKKSKALIQIGELVIVANGMEKTIGDFKTFIAFDKLLKINLTKYYPAIFHRNSKLGNHSYVVRFEFNGRSDESFLVSEIAIDNVKLSILDNLKYLEKTLNVELKIK